MNAEKTTNGNSKDGDNSNMKNELKATLDWILNVLKRTPFPYSPQEALLRGHDSKKPFFFDGKYGKPLNWGDYQDLGKIQKNPKLFDKLMKKWHDNELVTAIGATAGFNGEFIVAYIDFDLGNYLSKEAMMSDINNWIENYPALKMAPKLSSQSGGIHIVVGFERVDTNNKIDFTLTKGTKKAGELFVGSGSTCILVGEGIEGNYLWLENAYGEVPVFPDPESIGVFEAKKFEAKKEEIKVNNNYKISSIYDNPDTVEQAREALAFIPVTQFDNDYQGWIYIGMACQSAGLSIDDWDAWSRGSKEYKNYKDIENHWKSFKDNPGGITAGTLFKFAKDNGWNPPRRNDSGYHKPLINTSNSQSNVSGTAALKTEPPSNVIPFRGQQQQLNTEDIKEEFRQLTEQTLSKSKLRLELNNIARENNLNPKEIQDAYREYCEELEDKESQADIKNELDELLKNRNQSLDLAQYLPGNLAKISEFSSRLCLRPELGLSAFLTVASSLLAVGTKIDLLDYSDFDQAMGLYTAICAEPSQKKSPLINKIALEPLLILQEEERQQFESQMDVFKLDYKLWKSNPEPDEPEPETPVMRRYFINGGSQAGIRNVLNTHSQKGWGVLVLTDELAASYKNNGKTYNAGLLEDFLSYYDGSGKFEALKDGFAGDFSQCLVSMLGGIQPGVISEYMNGNDTNGHWSRVNVVNQPVSPFLIPDNPPPSLDIKPMLVDFYRKLSQLPRLQLTLDAKAKAGFTTLNNKCELYRVEAKTQALASLWGKMPGKIGRFAALLHIIDQVWNHGTVTTVTVSAATLRKAAALAKFYFYESQSLYSNCTDGELAPQLLKILDLSEKRKAPISPRDVIRSNREFRKLKSDDVRAMFYQLVALGYGQLEGSGVKIQFSKNLSPVSPVVTTTGDTSKDIQDRDSSYLSPVSPEKKENFQSKQLTKDNPTFLDKKPLDVKPVVTVVTTTENDDTEPIRDCHHPGDTVVTTGDSGDKNSDRSTSAPEPEPLPDDYRPTLTELTSADILPAFTWIAFDENSDPESLGQSD